MDVVMRVKNFPKPGETIKCLDFQYIPGGKSSNQCASARRLGAEVKLIGRIGNDSFGEILLNYLNNEKIDSSDVVRSATKPSGTAIIFVNEKSENMIVVSGGANDEISPKDINDINITREDIVIATLEHPQDATMALFSKARIAGAITILNAAPALPLLDGLLDTVDYLIINEIELATYAESKITNNIEHVIELSKKIRHKKKQKIIVTLGNKGVVCINNDEIIKVDARKVDSLDTTAAGDCFVGAFAVALAEGKNLHYALEFANVAASISVTRFGASSSLPDRNEVDSIINSNI